MKRTSLVLAALVCATLGWTAEPTFAQYGHEHRAPSGHVSQRDVDVALYRLRQAESNHVAARRFLDESVAIRHQITSQIGVIRQDLSSAIATNDRYHTIERLRRDLANAESRLANHDRNLRDVARAVDTAQRDARAAEEAFYAVARRDPAYRDAADRVSAAQRELDFISADILRRLESTREYRALLSERDEAIERLQRISGHRYIGAEHITRAEQAVEYAENNLNRLRDRALSEDPNYRAARSDVDGEQAQLDRVWTSLKRGLADDANYRRAVDQLNATQRSLQDAEERVNIAQGEVDAIARELDRYGDQYISFVDIGALERDARRLEQKLCDVDVQINRGRGAVEQTECEIVEARRDYQRILSEYNRACEDDRRYRGRDDRDNRGDRGDRYGR